MLLSITALTGGRNGYRSYLCCFRNIQTNSKGSYTYFSLVASRISNSEFRPNAVVEFELNDRRVITSLRPLPKKDVELC